MYPLRLFVSRTAGRLWLVLLVAILAGCGESNTVSEPPSITLLLSTTALTLQQGEDGTVMVGVARSSGFSNTVTFTVTGAPGGLTTSFSPASLERDAATSQLTITASAAVPPGTYPLTLHVNARGAAEQTATITVTVTMGPVFGGA
jgi:hypothetical protein